MQSCISKRFYNNFAVLPQGVKTERQKEDKKSSFCDLNRCHIYMEKESGSYGLFMG